jgi:hypothetical protein
MSKLLRTAEVSEITNTPVPTLRWWRHTGVGPPSFKLGKKTVVYSADGLELWIRQQEAASTRGDRVQAGRR